jgi:hypothetical protein
MTKIILKRLNKYRIKPIQEYLLIVTISVSYISCGNHVDLDSHPNITQKYTGLMKYCNDTTINILKSKKSGDWIFSKYRKDTLNGLTLLYKDSIVFMNDTFFPVGKSEYQQFDFIDSLKIEFITRQDCDNRTINYRYIFQFNDSMNKWLPVYAEKKEFTTEQSVYYFIDTFQHDISMDNSLKTLSQTLFTSVNNKLFLYKYKNKNYSDSIEIQIKEMKSAKIASFKNIFTVDHAEEILRNYPVNKTNIVFLNNIAYYLEQMSIIMPAITILETIITDYPKRIVCYLNLSDALTKNGLKIKAEKTYRQYCKLLKK